MDGNLMFRCGMKKINWYLNRNLAKIVDPGDPCVIQLIFKPKGPGHANDEFFLQDKENICVVCGSNHKLTKHHVVPYGYRRFFSKELKEHSYYDVLVLCFGCHKKYEQAANSLKKQLAIEHDIPIHGEGCNFDHKLHRVRYFSTTLLKWGHKIPPERRMVLENEVASYLKKEEVTKEDLEELTTKKFESGKEFFVFHGQKVVAETTDLHNFIKRWRKHFFDTMQPQFLPVGWTVERSMTGRKEGLS